MRNLLRFLLVALVLVVVRYLVMAFRRAMTGSEGAQTAAQRPSPPPGTVPTEGTLKKDPVCGTFVAESASIKETIDGSIVHFCSTTCRDRFRHQG